MTLDELRVGECARVSELLITGGMRRRLLDIGLIKGTVVRLVGKSPFGDPSAYLIRGCVVAIRKRDARGVIVSQ